MDSGEDFTELLDKVWNWHLKDAPEFASASCVHDYDDKLESLSLASYDERKNQCQEFLKSLLEIPFHDLSKSDQISYKVLKEDLTCMTDGYRWKYHSVCNPINFIDNLPNDFSAVVIDSMEFASESDYQIYIKRLRAVPMQINEQIDLMKEAIKMKTTLHRCSIEGAIKQFKEFLAQPSEEQVFYKPFKEILVKNSEITSSQKNDLCREALDIINNKIRTAFQGLHDFLETTYLPNTRDTYGVYGLLDGEEYYKACLRWHLSTDLSPNEVHEIGLKEVARIQDGMKQVMKDVNFNGTLPEFLEHLKNDKQFYYENADDLLREYKHLIYEFIEPKLENYFQNIPSAKCAIRPMPFPGPGGMCYPPSVDGKRPGVFYVNLYNPKKIPTFSMMVLSLHEACPGHFLQGAFALERKVSAFRRARYLKTQAAPFYFPIYTCFVEGWACYAEYLGLEMKAYRTPYELFGRYSDEMFRAARLVVDTGLHLYGWSREEAITYMQENTCISLDGIESEVNRYMMWPGQACGYKIGEIKIRELRKMAEEKLGDSFNIKEFHEVILSLGRIPIHVLDDVINDWVKEKESTVIGQ